MKRKEGQVEGSAGSMKASLLASILQCEENFTVRSICEEPDDFRDLACYFSLKDHH